MTSREINPEDVPTKAERKVLEWIAGILAVIITGGLLALFSVLWAMYGGQIEMKGAISGFDRRIETVETRLAESMKDRYSADSAAQDRATTMGLITKLLTKNESQDAEIAILREFKARAEERLRLSNNGN